MRRPRQIELLPKTKRNNRHGGSLAIKKRRSTRPLRIKQSHHITLKFHHAVGPRSLFRHKKMILGLIRKNAFRFQVKVYEYAIQGNHLHLLVKAKSRVGLQNFFRVVAGHSAQKILLTCPLPTLKHVTSDLDHDKKPSSEPNQEIEKSAGGAPPKQRQGCRKNQRKFWSYLLFSRVVSWGKDFQNVVNYIQKNTLELLQIVAYHPRNADFKSKKRPQRTLQSTS